MRVIIGSIIIILLFLFGIWLIISPSFQKIGEKSAKVKKLFKDEEEKEQ